MCNGRTLNFALIILLVILAARAPAQQPSAEHLAIREEAALRAAAESVANSVVQIRTIGGLDAVGDTPLAAGPTTGLVISPDGFIISSAFNFVQRPSSILVTLPSAKQAAAELVATDHSRMLVLLKVNGVAGLPVPPFAPPDEIRPGQWAIAVGRTFRADRTNVAIGIISAVGRMFGKALQTDAAVSMANYGGPLIDIRGRVLGVLVPMAPQSTSEVAGVEWYDSGIGFAVPLASIGPAIERMKRGEDQHTGILGISFAGRRPLTSPAELAAVRPDSPAGRAGLKKGDRIVEIERRPIQTQNDLRLALGSRYAGETVRVVAKRGDERIEQSVTLIGKLPPFRHAFLGILPQRPTAAPKPEADEPGGGDPDDDKDSEQSAQDTRDQNDEKEADATDDEGPRGVVVRMVYPGSPAAEARIVAGDRILQINGAKVNQISDAISEMNSVAPEDIVTVTLQRGEESLALKLTATRLPTTVPGELPRSSPAESTGEAASAAGETRDLKLAAMPQNCRLYIPAAHAAGRPHGLILWLHAPGESDPEAVIKQWQPICDRDGLILVVPTAEDVKQWERTELEYLGRLVERVIRQYRPDPRRIVVYGQAGGGGMAYLLALPNREVFTGIAATLAPLPRQVRVPDSEPAQRIAIYAGLPADAGQSAELKQGLQKIATAGYPITMATIADAAGKLSAKECDDLARWIDTLDRF
jgi:serine protease Do